MKYNLSVIMKQAWSLYRANNNTFAECLRKAWACAKAGIENARRVQEAKEAAGISEEVHSWYGWKMIGREVIHGSVNLFQVTILKPLKGEGATFKQSYFGLSQTQEIA